MIRFEIYRNGKYRFFDAQRAVVRGETIPDYYVTKDGEFISTKRGNVMFLKPNCNNKDGYPRVCLRINKVTTTQLAHRVVCETWHAMPNRPTGVTKKEWDATPESVKRYVNVTWQAHHIDHDKQNFHPSNLEWTTAKENIDAYQVYRAS